MLKLNEIILINSQRLLFLLQIIGIKNTGHEQWLSSQLNNFMRAWPLITPLPPPAGDMLIPSKTSLPYFQHVVNQLKQSTLIYLTE